MKKNSGQNNQRGIFKQNEAAMSLFLQFLKDPNFSYIQLEPKDSEDFDLVFKDGKKIICEVKFRKEKFSYSQLKELLQKIIQKQSINTQSDKYEILIICKSINSKLIFDVKNVRFFDAIKDKFQKEHSYIEQMLNLLPKVNFWILPNNINQKVINALLLEFAEIWLPPNEVRRLAADILQIKIFQYSTCGKVYSSVDFDKDISDFKKEIQQSSDYFNNKKTREEQFYLLEQEIENGCGISWGTASISAFSSRWDLISFAIDRLKKKNDLNLETWNDLWQIDNIHYFTASVFHIFENNLHSAKNQKYVLDYIKNMAKKIRGFYRDDFFYIYIVRIITKIINGKDGAKYLNDIFAIIEKLITSNQQKFFYLRDNNYEYSKTEKEELCKLLHKIYISADGELKNKIFDLLVKNFNIIEDSGQFSFYAPKEIFKIICNWLNEDFIGRFDKLIETIVNQYKLFYKKLSKKLVFNGWEFEGIVSCSWADDHQVNDRHFIIQVLAPAISKYYNNDPAKGWNFIKGKCINKIKEVSEKRPDFLNRSVYQIVLDRYASDDPEIAEEAFDVLKEFISQTKGIPSKSELILQKIAGSNQLSDAKKWSLIELIKNNKVTYFEGNIFIRQILTDFAKNGEQKAKNELEKLFKNPACFSMPDSAQSAISTIRTFINSDSDFAFAVKLFQTLIESDNYQSGKCSHVSPFYMAELLHNIILKDYGKGLEIIRNLEAQKTLNKDLQIIYCYSLFNDSSNDNSDPVDLLMKVYSDVVDPFLNKMKNDISNIREKIYVPHAREAFVKFAIRLAKKKKVAEALRIIDIFVNDPDPDTQSQQISDGKETCVITSVRGWCGWALMECCILEGREYIQNIINLAKKIINDDNYYVVHMACYALAQIAKNRLSVLPTDKNMLFFNDDKEQALKMAKEVEQIAFNLLGKLRHWSTPVQKAIGKSILSIFDHIRMLNEKEALLLINSIVSLPNKIIEEAAQLFIYYAEIRKNAYKNWQFKMPGLYDDLEPDKYDQEEFRKILKGAIKKLQEENPDKCYKFASTFEYMDRKLTKEKPYYKDIVLEYFRLLTNVYSRNVFNLTYQIIEDKLKNSDKYCKQWYNLFLKCLKLEKNYYKNEIQANKSTKIFWLSSFFYTPNILELIYEKMEIDKFMEAAKIFFYFPKKVELQETKNLTNIIFKLSKTGGKHAADAKKIIENLIDKNPTRYWEYKKEIKN